jgi:hypothetical protein
MHGQRGEHVGAVPALRRKPEDRLQVARPLPRRLRARGSASAPREGSEPAWGRDFASPDEFEVADYAGSRKAHRRRAACGRLVQ